MSKSERDNDTARLSKARRVLEKMQKQLARTTAAHLAADEHLSKLTVDGHVLRRPCVIPQCRSHHHTFRAGSGNPRFPDLDCEL